MLFYKKKIGNIGESAAADFLKKEKKFKIIERNYTNFLGEIDIIAKSKNDIVFVEVKTRTSTDFGYASQAVDYKKQEKIKKIAQIYTKDSYNTSIRFDVVEVYIDKSTNQISKINHIENAFGV